MYDVPFQGFLGNLKQFGFDQVIKGRVEIDIRDTMKIFLAVNPSQSEDD